MQMCLKLQVQLDGTLELAAVSCRLQLVRSQGFLLVFAFKSFKSQIFHTCVLLNLLFHVRRSLVFELS